MNRFLLAWLFTLTALAVAYANAPTYLSSSGTPEGARGVSPYSYPVDAVPVSSSSGNVAAASAAATLAGAAAKTTYIAGFRCGGGGATAASLVNITITGLLGGTATYTMGAVAGATLISQPVLAEFWPPIPASAVNTAIVVTMPSLGAGNTNASCNAWGYQL